MLVSARMKNSHSDFCKNVYVLNLVTMDFLKLCEVCEESFLNYKSFNFQFNSNRDNDVEMLVTAKSQCVRNFCSVLHYVFDRKETLRGGLL